MDEARHGCCQLERDCVGDEDEGIAEIDDAYFIRRDDQEGSVGSLKEPCSFEFVNRLEPDWVRTIRRLPEGAGSDWKSHEE